MLRVIVALLICAFTAVARPASAETAYQFDSDVPARWYDLAYDRIRAESLPPPVASRILGAAGVALYQAIVSGAQRNVSLVGQLNELTALPGAEPGLEYHWPSAANIALARVLIQLFAEKPDSVAAFIALRSTIRQELADDAPAEERGRAKALGRAVGSAVFAWLSGDGFTELNNCAYTPPIGPGLWEPTPPAFAPAVQPCWGQLRPFVLRAGDECIAPPPPAFSTDPASKLFLAAQEVYDVGNALTPEQETIALYWADGAGTGTPPGHWIDIVRQISIARPLSLARSAEAFARVGIAVADAFIGCWNAKFEYNLLRPVTYINDNIDPAWVPFIGTPPFPEYTSGHSTQSGAAARVLTDMFGPGFAFTDTLRTDQQLTPVLPDRSFTSFVEAAEEATVSRLYGGIHYRLSNDRGNGQGVCIGQTIVERVRFRTTEEAR